MNSPYSPKGSVSASIDFVVNYLCYNAYLLLMYGRKTL